MDTLYSDITSEIRNDDSGPRIGAFFDLDRTLLADYSAKAFMVEQLLGGKMSARGVMEQLLAAINFSIGLSGFSSLITTAARLMKGASEQEMIDFGQEVFNKRLAAEIFPESRALVHAHLEKGHSVLVVSSATIFQVKPIADDLGIDHILCSRLEVRNGKLTGRVIEPTCWGEGKLTAVERLVEAREIDLERSYFYTDAVEDLPLLEAVGNPRPVNPDSKLARIARQREWPVHNFGSRGTPGIMEIVGTSMAYGAMIGTVFAAGLPTLLLTGSRRKATDVTLSTWADLSAAFAGIDLLVEGEEHIWSNRPAIFLFNHQSKVDVMIGAKLLRRGVTGVAKKEAKNTPIVGQFMQAVGAVFIDRYNPEKAIQTLEPVVEALRNGTSIGIAPEGTRSVTDKLGSFKKGPFHMAIQARVPMVPVVILNATDALPRGSSIIRPATIGVKVLPPVMTDDWDVETIEEHIAEVRQMYLDVLGQSDDPAPIQKGSKAPA